MRLYGEWVEANVLARVAHRQYVFNVPKLLRSAFERQRARLGELCRIAARLLAFSWSGHRHKMPGTSKQRSMHLDSPLSI